MTAQQTKQISELGGNRPLRTFEMSELVLGCVLGSGGFSSVYSIRHQPNQAKHNAVEFDLGDLPQSTKSTKAASHESTQSSGAPSTASPSTSPSSSFNSSSEIEDPVLADENESSSHSEHVFEEELALKTLHCKTLRNDDTSKRALEDMSYEVAILASLPAHPNIIRLHGVSKDFFTSPSNAFLVLEKLDEPLDKAIRRWRSETSETFVKRVTNFRKSKVSQAERIQQVCLDLAKAMSFLHSRQIIFRDLKPANIGLDKQGNVRLFDFACARVMQNRPDAKMKHRCGTLRYMAPEVARKEPYDRSADVYSFGMVLWEVATLDRPYASAMDRAELTAKVVEPGKHPKLKRVSSVCIQNLLERCWRDEPADRPAFPSIHYTLSAAVERVLQDRS